MKTEGSLPHSRQPATFPCPGTNCPHPVILCLRLVLQNAPPPPPSLLVIIPKYCKYLCSPLSVSHAPFISQSGSSWNANFSSATQEIRRMLCNPKFHRQLHKCSHLFLFRARSIQSTTPFPYPITWSSTFTSPSHLRLGQGWRIFLRPHSKILYLYRRNPFTCKWKFGRTI